LKRFVSLDVQNYNRPNKALIKGISEMNQPMLNEILKHRSLNISPDRLIEEMAGKTDNEKQIIDILRTHINDKWNNDISTYVEKYINSWDASTLNLIDNEIKDQERENKFEFLKAGSKRKPIKFIASKITKNPEHKAGFSFNYGYKKIDMTKQSKDAVIILWC
jgi:hypothetical protein